MPTPNETIEAEIQQALNNCIENFISFRFNAGAGAGKTYALVEAIRFILKNKYVQLKSKNQQVICITYTNVAVREIKDRLGDSDIINVSTIHERLWDLIKIYQNELISIHKDNILEKLNDIEEDLSNKANDKYKKFATLSEKEKIDFIDFISLNIEIFYKNIDEPAAQFKGAFNTIDGQKPAFLQNMLSNVDHFKVTVKSVFKRRRYQDCLDRISLGTAGRIEYDSKSNSDRLEYMKFSHDTLLDYGLKIAVRHPMLCRIIADKYPYIFVDEYQDTNEKTIDFIKQIYNSASQNNKKWLVGYFGDTAQNIYDDGIGSGIYKIHPDIKSIDKQFNRRSHTQIIDVINVIRNDDIHQIPMFPERNLGEVKFFYHVPEENVEKQAVAVNFLNKYRNSLSRTNSGSLSEKIHCLVLTNKLIAQLNGFGDIYELVSKSENIYFSDFNSMFLSHDIEKLHPTVLLIYKLLSLRNSLLSPATTYHDLLGDLNEKVYFANVISAVSSLKDINAATLSDFVNGFSAFLECEIKSQDLSTYLLGYFSVKIKDIDVWGDFKNYFSNQLYSLMYKNASDSETKKDNMVKVNEILSVSIDQWNLWIDFIDRKEKSNVVYHTYHGTKGEEYENVAIIMEHKFGKDKDKFKFFFDHLQSAKDVQDERLKQLDYLTKFDNTKNLIYVACSRAIRNLRVLYLDDIGDVQSGIEKVFGEISKFEYIK